MTRRCLHLVLTLSLTPIVSCTYGTDIKSIWFDERHERPIHSIMIIGVSNNDMNRRIFERGIARQFEKKGVQAFEAFNVIPSRKKLDEDALRERIKGQGVDAVLVTRLVGVDTETQYNPGYSYVVPQSYYYGFYGYYSTVYSTVYQPGYTTSYDIVKLETNIYDTVEERLIWAALSETFDPQNVEDVVAALGPAILESLEKNNFLPAK